MGNAAGKDDSDTPASSAAEPLTRPGPDPFFPPPNSPVRRARSVDSMGATPPHSPAHSRSPLMFAPQVPVAPLQSVADVPSVFNQIWGDESNGAEDVVLEKGIPTLITWNFGGRDVMVEGSWDNWNSRRQLQRSGKDYSILLVLPSGVYRYRFVVDGEWRYVPDLPCVADETGDVCNVLDVHEYVPENLESVSEFESPPSPTWSYSHPFPSDEDLSKEPPGVPPQLHLTVLGMQNPEDAPTKPQHAVLNHLFIEKGSGLQSLVALGLTHRFQSKYVTVVLYKSTRS